MTDARADPSDTDPLAGLARRAAAGEPEATRGLLGALQALPRFRGDCSTLHFAQRVGLLTALNARRRFQLREQLAPRAVDADTEALPGREASPAEALDPVARDLFGGASPRPR